MTAILVTGVAGFVGCEVARRLLNRGDTVIGLDNFDPYYDPELKRARLRRLAGFDGFRFAEVDIGNTAAMVEEVCRQPIDRVVHMAARPGVRNSLLEPGTYVQANLVCFNNVLELCRSKKVNHFVFASSSSVYGANAKRPYAVADPVNHPLSLYAATKKANELMAHSYSHLFGIPVTGLRFFTVYGPWGRPDMAPLKFTRAIFEGTPIDVYNRGEMLRDFTYIDDAADCVVAALDRIPEPDAGWNALCPNPASSSAPFRIHNVGSQKPVALMRFIRLLEEAVGRPAIKQFKPMQAGDIEATAADIDTLVDLIGFGPSTALDEGIRRLVAWYPSYYRK